MSDFENFENEEKLEVTQEMLDNFASDISDYFESDYLQSDTMNFADTSYSKEDEDISKSVQQIREERLALQEETRRKKKKKRRSALVNNLMPLSALVLLVCTISYMNSLQFGLVITYNNEQIAMVENAGVVEEATSLIDSRIINKSLDTLEDEPQYRVAVVNNTSDFQNSTELSRSIIANDNVLADHICGVFVDGTFVGALSTQEEAEEVLSELLEEQKKASAELGKVESVDFNSSIALEIGLYARSSVVDKDTIKDRLINNVDISYTTIVLQEQNVKIKYKTEFVVDESKSNNYEKVTTKGQIGEGIATNRVTYVDGVQISTEHEKVVATKKPVNQVVTVSPDNEYAVYATNNSSDKDVKDTDTTDSKSESTKEESAKTESVTEDISDSTNENATVTEEVAPTEVKQNSQFVWPAPNCGSITNDFGYQGEKLHKGIDISGPDAEGQPVVASASGYVTTAVFDYGSENYGCYVIIDHGNGYQTLYAQLSDIYVAPGSYVEQGETIAAVGSTGDSTGAHLHFEIIENGEYVNPANYLY